VRVLTTVTGSPSHARAVLPFARALVDAGHEVLAACPPELAGVFDGTAIRVEAVMPSMADAAAAVGPMLAQVGDAATTADVVPLLFAGPHVTEAARSLDRLDADAPSDLVLRDGTDMAGLLHAEHLGVPHLPAPSGGANVMTPAMMAPMLARRRADLGLPTPADPALAPHGRLDCMPQAWSLAAPGTPPATAFRQEDEVVRGQALPGWVADLPAGRPLVVAALGTALPMMAGRDGPAPVDPAAALRDLLAGMNRLDAEVVLATGGLSPDGTGAAHVHLTDWMPQTLLLQCADLFVTHGGYNGIREAVRHGVPMVVVPQFGDQEHNADRITALGLGARVPTAGGAAPETIAATAAEVLADGAVRAEVRRAQRAMLALPPIDEGWLRLVGQPADRDAPGPRPSR
jgi:UDP:flavonoid glycosyltransferase YjiC (YdhE family)